MRKSKEVVKMNKSQNGTVAGALYCMSVEASCHCGLKLIMHAVITNEPKGNFVVAAALNDDGSVVSLINVSL